MILPLPELLAAAGIVLGASVLQGAAGFGFSLFATPLLVWLGLPLPGAIILVAISSLAQSAAGARHLRAEVPWRTVVTASIVRVVFLAIGLLLLKRVVRAPVAQVKLAMGIAICALVLLQAAWRPRPAASLRWGWGALAFAASGVLAGLFAMGGPPLVLWSLAHDWSAAKTRGFLFATFALAIPVQIVLLFASFGRALLPHAGLALLLLPVVLAGSMVGIPFGNRLRKRPLILLAYGILLAIGLSCIVPALRAG
jgi:uncharacterized membrane protein YfcA